MLGFARNRRVRDRDWQQNVNPSPFSWTGLDGDFSMALLHDAVHSGKPQSGSASDLFCCVEGFKGMQACFFIHANAAIGDAYTHVLDNLDAAGRSEYRAQHLFCCDDYLAA